MAREAAACSGAIGPYPPSVCTWPKRWQPEAIEALERYVGTDYIVEGLVDDPATAIHGTAFAGYVFVGDDGRLWVIYDRSGRADVYPWRLLLGPVLQLTVRTPGKRRKVIYRHPDWNPPQG
jgi:hypothetical protein